MYTTNEQSQDYEIQYESGSDIGDVNATMKFRMINFVDGCIDSQVSIGTIPDPYFNYQSGLYSQSISIQIYNVLQDVPIYYTLDGSEPTTGSFLYIQPIVLEIGNNYIIKTICIAQG